MNDRLRLRLSKLYRIYDQGAILGVLAFALGAFLMSPFAFYAGYGVGSAFASLVIETRVAFVAPILLTIGLVLAAALVMVMSGLAFGLPAWALEALARFLIRTARRSWFHKSARATGA